MASETTELTFVRCPSCRSLVPASAARCRICNHPLENNTKSEESEASKSASRVRQNTMSADPNEVASAIATAHAENATANGESGSSAAAPKVGVAPVAPTSLTSTPVAPGPMAAAPTPSAQDEVFDPLSAYLEEMDEVVEEPSMGASTSLEDPLGLTAGLEEKSEDPSVVSLLEDLEDDGDSWGIPPTEKQVAKGEVSQSAKAPPVHSHAPATDSPFGHTELAQNAQKSTPPSGGKDERRGQPGPVFPRGGEERRGASGGMPRPDRGNDQRNDQKNDQRNTEPRNPDYKSNEQRGGESRAGDARPQKERPQGMFGGPQSRREERREERRDERKEERRDAQRQNERREERKDERRENESRDRGTRPEDSRQQQARQSERQPN